MIKHIKRHKNGLLVGITTIIMMLSLAGIPFFMGCKSDASSKTMEKVRLGISKSFFTIPVHIAKEQGYFSEEGLDVTVSKYNSGKHATQNLFSGDVDISTVADMPVVFNSFKRQDFCIFATFANSYSSARIVARKDRGIRTGADLKGKRVGANMGTSSHFFLGVFLLHNQLRISDVKIVDIRSIDLPEALKNNRVDAISIWQPFSQEAMRLLQDNAIELPNPEVNRTTFNFAVMKKFAGDHPETLKKFLRAIEKAGIFIRNNREKAQGIIVKNFKLEKEVIRGAWDDFIFEISLDQALLVAWDEIARWAIENKFIDNKKFPNYLNYIYMDAMEAIKPESITIIR